MSESYALTESTPIVDHDGVEITTMPRGTVLEGGVADEHWMAVTLPSGRSGFALRSALEPAPEPEPAIATPTPSAAPRPNRAVGVAGDRDQSADPAVEEALARFGARSQLSTRSGAAVRAVAALIVIWVAITAVDYYLFRERFEMFLPDDVRVWLLSPGWLFLPESSAFRDFGWWANIYLVLSLFLAISAIRTVFSPTPENRAQLTRSCIPVLGTFFVSRFIDAFGGPYPWPFILKGVSIPALLLLALISTQFIPEPSETEPDGLIS